MAFSLQAQAESIHFQLPAQALASSLSQIAQQAKIQLLFDEELLRNIKAPALNGDYSPEAAIGALLKNSNFSLVKVDNTYVVRPAENDSSTSGSALQLGAMSVIGNGQEVDAATVGRSTLNQEEMDRHLANNIPSLINTLPGVTLGGSLKPGGQTVNIWGLGDAEDVPMSVDGATKSGFERYQQGSIFIEPEMIKRVEVEKGPHSPRPATAALAAPSAWKPRTLRTCCRKAAMSGPWSSTATAATAMNRPTPRPCMAAPRTVGSTCWPTGPSATATT